MRRVAPVVPEISWQNVSTRCRTWMLPFSPTCPPQSLPVSRTSACCAKHGEKDGIGPADPADDPRRQPVSPDRKRELNEEAVCKSADFSGNTRPLGSSGTANPGENRHRHVDVLGSLVGTDPTVSRRNRGVSNEGPPAVWRYNFQQSQGPSPALLAAATTGSRVRTFRTTGAAAQQRWRHFHDSLPGGDRPVRLE